ncbi:MAG: PEP-CTERM sorting domain-containing protein [Planctomycetota bacterium]
MANRPTLLIRSLACAVPALVFAGPLSAAVLFDTNGFETSGTPETYASGNLVGQNGWGSFAGQNSLAVDNNRTITGGLSVRSLSGSQTAAREISVTPDLAGTDFIIAGTIGNDTNDDTGAANVAITTGTGGFDLLRLRRDGGNEQFQAFAANSSGVDTAGDTLAADDAVSAGVPNFAYEYEITLRYNPGTNDDQARVLVREIGGTTWTAISAVAGATLDSEDFADLGYDADSGTLYVALQANNPDFRSSVRFDDLVVSTAVIPEPASLALLSAGGLCLLGRRRRA